MTNDKLKRLLTEEGYDKFNKALSRDKVLGPAFERMINSLLQDLDRTTTLKDFENPQWSLARAYRDGGRHYLEQLLNVFKEK